VNSASAVPVRGENEITCDSASVCSRPKASAKECSDSAGRCVRRMGKSSRPANHFIAGSAATSLAISISWSSNFSEALTSSRFVPSHVS